MNSKFINSLTLLILAIVFTIGLTFASIELPKLTDNFIDQNINFVNVFTGGGDLQGIKTELFIQHFHLRTIGYLCLTLIIALIVAGFITEKTGLTSLGAFAIFLPVFGHFAATMFFLGGLGFLRLLWLPGLDISFNIMKLGDAVFIPYRILIDVFNLVGINIKNVLPYILIVSGLLIFCLGTLIWLYTYYQKAGVAKFWIYKFSRHPQYFGWIIWSYGILFLPGANLKQSYSISDSLPWLISTFIIIGVAMLEEIKMSKIHGKEYEDYRKGSFFMIPFPKYFCRVVSAPFKVFFNKNYPTNKREITTVLSFYFSLIILFTLLLNASAKMEAPGKWVFENEEKRSVQELAQRFKEAHERRDKDKLASALIKKEDAAIPFFINFLNHIDPVIREFSVDALGKLKSEKAILPLIHSLHDNNNRVVRSAVRSLGNFCSDEAAEPLIILLESDDTLSKKFVVAALANMKNKKAVQAIIPIAEGGKIKPTIDIITALKYEGSKRAESLLIKYMSDEDSEIRSAAVIGALDFNSSDIEKALTKAQNDENWEVRLFAEEVLKNKNNN